jgi:ComF family protein
MPAEALTRLDSAFERLRFEQAPILVIPVPDKARRRQRGFSQAERIAQSALKFHPAGARLQLVPDLPLRTRDTASQIGLSSHQRRANLRGGFAVRRPGEVTGREVILMDDVYTTGATATECAQVLRRAGASKVRVAKVARTRELASNYGQFRPGRDDDADDEDAANLLTDEQEEEQKVTVAHAAGG